MLKSPWLRYFRAANIKLNCFSFDIDLFPSIWQIWQFFGEVFFCFAEQSWCTLNYKVPKTYRLTSTPPIPYVRTDPAPTAALCRYVSMSVAIGTHIASTAGWLAGAMAEQRPLASFPIMAASWGYQSRIVLELEIQFTFRMVTFV